MPVEFEMKVTRTCCLKGQRVEAGARVRLSAVDAYGLLSAGRGTLLRDADRATLAEELQRQQRRAVGAAPAWPGAQ